MDKITVPDDVPMRWSTLDSMNYFDSLLGFDKSQYGQDWEIELADPERVEEFLDVYENRTRNDDDRFTLMTLIVCSFNNSMGDDYDVKVWDEIRARLLAEFRLHQFTILYWCSEDADDLEEVLPLTPLMRKVWNIGMADM